MNSGETYQARLRVGQTVEWVAPTYTERGGDGEARQVARGDVGRVVTVAGNELVVTFPGIGAFTCGRDEVRVVA
jgi:hypothetical protein